jgi:hypothetical protein
LASLIARTPTSSGSVVNVETVDQAQARQDAQATWRGIR